MLWGSLAPLVATSTILFAASVSGAESTSPTAEAASQDTLWLIPHTHWEGARLPDARGVPGEWVAQHSDGASPA